jgi:hypothetical protein
MKRKNLTSIKCIYVHIYAYICTYLCVLIQRVGCWRGRVPRQSIHTGNMCFPDTIVAVTLPTKRSDCYGEPWGHVCCSSIPFVEEPANLFLVQVQSILLWIKNNSHWMWWSTSVVLATPSRGRWIVVWGWSEQKGSCLKDKFFFFFFSESNSKVY